MYNFHYNVMKKKYGNNIRLLATDTDSLKYDIKTNDLYDDMNKMSEHFDFSDYPEDHKCYSKNNIKVIGKFKDETNSNPIVEFVGLRAKMYSQNVYYKYDDKHKAKKTAKGVKRSVKDKSEKLSHECYKKTVFESIITYEKMLSLRSYNHNISLIEQNKVALCNYDDKMYILDNGIDTLAYGHYSINKGKTEPILD